MHSMRGQSGWERWVHRFSDKIPCGYMPAMKPLFSYSNIGSVFNTAFCKTSEITVKLGHAGHCQSLPQTFASCSYL